MHTHTGRHTRAQIQTQGLGFFGQKPLITICLLLYKPTAELLSNTHANTHTHTHKQSFFALLVNCRVLIKNWSSSCCVSLLRWGIHYRLAMHRCSSRARVHIQTHVEGAHSADAQRAHEQSRPAEQSNTLSFRIFAMQTNKCSIGRGCETGWKKTMKTDRPKQTQDEERKKQTGIEMVWGWWRGRHDDRDTASEEWERAKHFPHQIVLWWQLF